MLIPSFFFSKIYFNLKKVHSYIKFMPQFETNFDSGHTTTFLLDKEVKNQLVEKYFKKFFFLLGGIIMVVTCFFLSNK